MRALAEAGYAMAALLVAMSVMAIMLSIAMPTWSHLIRREKEEELIFRGEQYARAINQYQRKYANQSPASIDVLIEQRLLRKKFKDPFATDKEGEFQMLYVQTQSPSPGQRAWASQGTGSQGTGGRGTGPTAQWTRRRPPGLAAASARCPLAKARSSGSRARTPGSPSGCTRARTATTSGSSSAWRCHRVRAVAAPEEHLASAAVDRAAAVDQLTGAGGHQPAVVAGAAATGRSGPQAAVPHSPVITTLASKAGYALASSASITASCNAGLMRWMAVFSRVGFTRLVRNTT